MNLEIKMEMTGAELTQPSVSVWAVELRRDAAPFVDQVEELAPRPNVLLQLLTLEAMAVAMTAARIKARRSTTHT